MHQQLLCSTLEVAISKALALNLSDNNALKLLEQKKLTIHLAEIGFAISFSVHENKMLVNTIIDATDCHIDTSFQTLLLLKKEQQLTELIKQNKLDITGDIKVAQHFARIVETMTIDWQSEIAKYIGDIATYKLNQAGKFIGSKIKFAAEQIQADASEWLVHEKRLAVTSSQISAFNQHVNDVAIQTKHLSTRVEHLEQIMLNQAAKIQG